ncbi:MAG: alpha amylase C-terminal domain-containing protein, partial [Xanthobacteraceae bacterium]
GVQRLVRDLNRLYASEPALHQRDCDGRGFMWTVGDDHSNSVYAFVRTAETGPSMLVISNMTPVPRRDYRIGVPLAGIWREIFNSDSGYYWGSNAGNAGRVETAVIAAHGHAQSIALILPPLATIFLRHDL